MLCFRLCVTGGVSAATIRDRVDEWVTSMKLAQHTELPPLVPASGIM